MYVCVVVIRCVVVLVMIYVCWCVCRSGGWSEGGSVGESVGVFGVYDCLMYVRYRCHGSHGSMWWL